MAILASPVDRQGLPAFTDAQYMPDGDIWMGQSLDTILGASLPNFDLSLYGLFGDASMEPFHFSPGLDFTLPNDSSGLLPGATSGAATGSQPDRIGWNPGEGGNVLGDHAEESEEDLLGDFCEKSLAWRILISLTAMSI